MEDDSLMRRASSDRGRVDRAAPTHTIDLDEFIWISCGRMFFDVLSIVEEVMLYAPGDGGVSFYNDDFTLEPAAWPSQP